MHVWTIRQLSPGRGARVRLRHNRALPNFEPTWNMAPTKDAPIVRLDPEAGERRLEAAKWGLVPFFTNDLAKARKPINAR
jgi:putative SOS response-associated peptidase YedK